MNFDSKILKNRVCFIIPISLFPLTGVSFRCFHQAIALRELGFEVSIICPKIREYDVRLNELNLKNITVLDCMLNFGSGMIRHLISIFLQWPFIVGGIIKTKPDIIQVGNPPDTIAMVVAILNRFLKKPLILDICDPGPESIVSHMDISPFVRWAYYLFSKFSERVVLSNVTGLITVNDVLRKLITSTRKGVSGKPFITFYNSLQRNDCKLAADVKNEINDNYVLYSGMLTTAILGLENLIKAFHAVWNEYKVKLYIVGDGPLRSRLEDIIQKTRATEYVKLLGHVGYADNCAYIKNARLCIIPYLDSPLTRMSTPTKLFDYMLGGKAIVFPDFPGFTEILGSNNAGMYPSGNIDGIAKAMSLLLKNRELIERTGDENRRLFTNYEYDGEIDKLVNLYSQVTFN